MSNLKTVPDTDVSYRFWSAFRAKAVLLLVHGYGASVDRWDFLASYFSKRRYSSYAYKVKGFGDYEGVRGDVKSFKVYFNDLRKLVGHIKRNHKGKKLFLVAESFGALFSFLLAARDPSLFSGLVLMSPAFGNNMQGSILQYLDTLFSFFVNPAKPQELPFTSEWCTQDLNCIKQMNKDPREFRFVSSRMGILTLIGMVKAKFAARRIRNPVLMTVSGKDYLISVKDGKNIFKRLKVADKTLLEYPDMLHALYIEKDREKVFADIYSWLEERL